MLQNDIREERRSKQAARMKRFWCPAGGRILFEGNTWRGRKQRWLDVSRPKKHSWLSEGKCVHVNPAGESGHGGDEVARLKGGAGSRRRSREHGKANTGPISKTSKGPRFLPR